jgi:hypothetical protein
MRPQLNGGTLATGAATGYESGSDPGLIRRRCGALRKKSPYVFRRAGSRSCNTGGLPSLHGRVDRLTVRRKRHEARPLRPFDSAANLTMLEGSSTLHMEYPPVLPCRLRQGLLMRPQLKVGTVGMTRLLAAAGLIFCTACSTGNTADWNQPGVLSPDGTAKARLLDMSGAYQLCISFDRGSCGAGSISARGAAASDLKLAWRDSGTLEVSAPHGLKLDAAPAAGGLNHRVQCGDRLVQVEVVRR